MPTVALCGVPEIALKEAGALAVFVSEKLAGVETPATEAVTTYVPATMFAFAVTLVSPLESVAAAAPSEAEAPLPGGANVTVTAGTGFPKESVTRTTSALKEVFTVVVCGEPETTAMEEAVAAVFVRENVTGVATPAAAAECSSPRWYSLSP